MGIRSNRGAEPCPISTFWKLNLSFPLRTSPRPNSFTYPSVLN
ncbi:Uncharacterised protein [Vibrio cholerae]|nr:Uncharacterised protein [Vibrio cholerae]